MSALLTMRLAAVVELERKKQSDAESKIATLKETIASLQK